MENRCKFISKLIFATIVLLVGGLFALPANESFALTQTITYNAKDKKYYYEDGVHRKGTEDQPLLIDVRVDKLIIDYTAADSFAYPFHFRIVNFKNGGKYYTIKDASGSEKNVFYAMYMVEEETQDKKFIMERIGAKGSSSNWYQVTPDSETTGETYLQPGATYHDESEKMGYTSPLFAFSSSIVFFQKADSLLTDGLLAIFDSDKYWLFEQRLGNTFLPTNTMAANAASYPAAYVFSVTGVKDDDGTPPALIDFTGMPENQEDDGLNIEPDKVFKFSNKQVSEGSPITIKEKKGANFWDWTNPIVGIVNLCMGKFRFTPAVYNVKNDHRMANSRLAIDFESDDLILMSFNYVCNGPSSDGLDGSDANAVEKVVSKLLISLGSVFRGAVSAMDGGKDLSLDALIFNEYKPTKIDFFEPEDGVYTTVFRSVIVNWFEAFKYFAILVLIILVPAIAIKVMMYSGTPNQRKVPGMISGWVIAVILMMFGPYLMKYVIKLNNVIVKIFRDNSDYSIYSVYNADYIANHQWAQDFQVGEDSETSFADWLQQNIQKKQEEWHNIAVDLDMVSGDWEASAAAISGDIGAIMLKLQEVGQWIGETIDNCFIIDYSITGAVEGNKNGSQTSLQIESVIDTLGKNKQLVPNSDNTASATKISVSGVTVSIGGLEFTLEGVKQKISAFAEGAIGLVEDAYNAAFEIYKDIVSGAVTVANAAGDVLNFLVGWTQEDGTVVEEIDADAYLADIEATRQAGLNEINNMKNSLLSGIDSVFDGINNKIASNLQTRMDAWIRYYQHMEDLAEMEDALALFTKNIDLENAMKTRAAKTYRLVIVALWYILMYQLVLLMFLYYKRLIMTAVLIILFPLVIMFYAFERFMGIDKPASFKTWVQEFLINVFIQSVHALLYVSLVETGLRIYEADADNWLFLLFAVTAIFPMEGIIKSMLGLKGSTVGSLASTAAKGAAAVAAAGAIAKTATQGAKGVDKKYDEKNKKNQEKAEKQDKKTEAQRAKRDNKIKRNELRGGNTEDSKKRLEELHAKDAKKDEARKKKRDKIQKRNERMKKYARRGQIARNIMGAATAVSVGLAAGGDPQDFMVGSGVGNVIAGKPKKNAKKADDKSSKDTKKSPTTPTQNNQTQQNGGQNAQKPTGAPQGQTQAAANANAATQAADQGRPMTASEAAQAQEKSALQQSFREQIAARQQTVQGTIGNTGVNSHTSINSSEE